MDGSFGIDAPGPAADAAEDLRRAAVRDVLNGRRHLALAVRLRQQDRELSLCFELLRLKYVLNLLMTSMLLHLYNAYWSNWITNQHRASNYRIMKAKCIIILNGFWSQKTKKLSLEHHFLVQAGQTYENIKLFYLTKSNCLALPINANITYAVKRKRISFKLLIKST